MKVCHEVERRGYIHEIFAIDIYDSKLSSWRCNSSQDELCLQKLQRKGYISNYKANICLTYFFSSKNIMMQHQPNKEPVLRLNPSLWYICKICVAESTSKHEICHIPFGVYSPLVVYLQVIWSIDVLHNSMSCKWDTNITSSLVSSVEVRGLKFYIQWLFVSSSWMVRFFLFASLKTDGHSLWVFYFAPYYHAISLF